MSQRTGFFKSFGYAGNGIKAAFKNEPNFRIHTTFAIITFILGVILHFSSIQWILLILTISYVIILELINTAIEEIVDKVSPNYSASAKLIKDISAAAVLIAAVSAALTGLLLFGPNILRLVSSVAH